MDLPKWRPDNFGEILRRGLAEQGAVRRESSVSVHIDLVLAQIIVDYTDHNPVALLCPLDRYKAVGKVLNY